MSGPGGLSAGSVVVTGAASGIGQATALNLRDAGVDVLAVDLDAPGLSRLDGVRTLVADLSDPADRDNVVAAGSDAGYLVNAAGIMRLKDIFDVTPQDIRAIYAVNVEAVWDLTSRIGGRLPAGGAIVNLSSMAAKLALSTEVAVYASSKAAVLSITRSFAHALAPRGVRVNAVCPGIIETPMQAAVVQRLAELRGSKVDEVARARLRSVPLGRTGTPEECAGVIRFLLSSEAAYVTGQAINIDGGVVM